MLVVRDVISGHCPFDLRLLHKALGVVANGATDLERIEHVRARKWSWSMTRQI